MPIEVGSVMEGVVTGITNFGAFVELPGGETGLVHISEIAEVYVKDINDYLKTNDKVTVKVISVVQKGKVGLSIKKANQPTQHNQQPQQQQQHAHQATSRSQPKKVRVTFEDKMAKFLKDSEERQQVLKRSSDTRRGGRTTNRKSV